MGSRTTDDVPRNAPRAALPVLDLARGDDPATVDDFRRALRETSRDVGFFYLVGHGIDDARCAEMFAVARRFFSLPDAAKRRVEMVNSPAFRGWTRLGGELTRGRTDWREQIDIGISRPAVEAPADEPWYVLQGPNLWPEELTDDLPTVEAWMRDLGEVGMRLLRHWAVALGQDAHVWDGTFADRPAPLLKLVHYPADPTATADDAGQGVGGHKDGGVLTLLMPQPGSTGLQVEHDGRWIDADPLDGAFVVNIGELLEVATQGLLKATEHRVRRTAADRLSIPYFHGPSLSGRFPPLTLPPELAAHATGVTQEAHNLLHDTYGANSLKSRLRAHPDVTTRYHSRLVEGGGGAAVRT